MKNFIFGLTLISAFSTFAWAGHETGNGGGVHYCPGKADKVEFYDLYEGKNASPRNPIPVYKAAYATEEVMLKDAIEKLNKVHPLLAEMVKEQIEFINKKENVIRVDKKLRQIMDSNYLWVDEGCSYEQLANWSDEDNVLYVRNSLMKLLEKKPLDFAAFKMHEALYKSVRQISNETNSDKVRLLNAYLFSDAQIPDSALTFVNSVNDLSPKILCTYKKDNQWTSFYTADRSEYNMWVQSLEQNGVMRCTLLNQKRRTFADFNADLNELRILATQGYFIGNSIYGQGPEGTNLTARFGVINSRGRSDLSLMIGKIDLKPKSFMSDLTLASNISLFDIENKKQLTDKDTIVAGLSYIDFSSGKLLFKADQHVSISNVKVKTFNNKKEIESEHSTTVTFDSYLNMVIENW